MGAPLEDEIKLEKRREDVRASIRSCSLAPVLVKERNRGHDRARDI